MEEERSEEGIVKARRVGVNDGRREAGRVREDGLRNQKKILFRLDLS